VEKQQDGYRVKMEILANMLVLKPYFKKFLILRKAEDKSLQSYFKVPKTKKNLIITNEGIETNIKFDHISSLVDNPYEEVNYLSEKDHLNQETASILNNYILKVNAVSEGRDLLILYISKPITVVNNSLSYNTNLIEVLNEVYKRIDNVIEYQITIKLITADSFLDLLTLTQGDLKAQIENTFQENLKLFEDAFGLYFTIKNKNNNSQAKIIYISYEDTVRLPQLLMKLCEINMTKKKKQLSTKKKKIARDIGYILDESEFVDTYYFAAFIDIEQDGLSIETLKDLLYSMN
jgi:hypothetical protein